MSYRSSFSFTDVETLARACPECAYLDPPPPIVQDDVRGETMCTGCGSILDQNLIAQDQEWRQFDDDSGSGVDKSRVGEAIDPRATYRYSLFDGVGAGSSVGGGVAGGGLGGSRASTSFSPQLAGTKIDASGKEAARLYNIQRRGQSMAAGAHAMAGVVPAGVGIGGGVGDDDMSAALALQKRMLQQSRERWSIIAPGLPATASGTGIVEDEDLVRRRGSGGSSVSGFLSRAPSVARTGIPQAEDGGEGGDDKTSASVSGSARSATTTVATTAPTTATHSRRPSLAHAAAGLFPRKKYRRGRSTPEMLNRLKAEITRMCIDQLGLSGNIAKRANLYLEQAAELELLQGLSSTRAGGRKGGGGGGGGGGAGGPIARARGDGTGPGSHQDDTPYMNALKAAAIHVASGDLDCTCSLNDLSRPFGIARKSDLTEPLQIFRTLSHYFKEKHGGDGAAVGGTRDSLSGRDTPGGVAGAIVGMGHGGRGASTHPTATDTNQFHHNVWERLKAHQLAVDNKTTAPRPSSGPSSPEYSLPITPGAGGAESSIRASGFSSPSYADDSLYNNHNDTVGNRTPSLSARSSVHSTSSAFPLMHPQQLPPPLRTDETTISSRIENYIERECSKLRLDPVIGKTAKVFASAALQDDRSGARNPMTLVGAAICLVMEIVWASPVMRESRRSGTSGLGTSSSSSLQASPQPQLQQKLSSPVSPQQKRQQAQQREQQINQQPLSLFNTESPLIPSFHRTVFQPTAPTQAATTSLKDIAHAAASAMSKIPPKLRHVTTDEVSARVGITTNTFRNIINEVMRPNLTQLAPLIPMRFRNFYGLEKQDVFMRILQHVQSDGKKLKTHPHKYRK